MEYAIDNIIKELGFFSILQTDDEGYRHRKGYAPMDDISDLPGDIQNAITALWTPEVINNYQEHLKRLELQHEYQEPSKIYDMATRLNDLETTVDILLDSVEDV